MTLATANSGLYGQAKIRTPSLDRMASEGMRFTQFYSGSPVCAPSRAAALTGLHTGHGYVRDNKEFGGWLDEEEKGQLPLKPGTFTIGRLLQQAGYRTALVGKWGLGGPDTTGLPNDHGFDFFFGYLDQKQAHNYYPTHLWKNRDRYPLRNPYFSPHQTLAGDPSAAASYAGFAATDYAPDVMADQALQFVRENRERPFFLYFAPPIPHLALQVPDAALGEYADAFDDRPYLGEGGYLPHRKPRAAYAAMITGLDSHVGRLLALLRELNLDGDTLVVFSSDNGTTYSAGVEAAYFNSVGPLRGLKGSVYEGGIRVPFIARWPGRIAAGSVSAHVGAFWDLMPTFAGLTGRPVPADTDGLSFLPTLLGREGQRVHDYLYWEYHGLASGLQAVRMGPWKGVRVGAHDNPDGPIELYNMDSDIGERTNVAARHPNVVARLRAAMNSRTASEIPEWNFPPGTAPARP